MKMKVIVHHWDADGISSAAILMREIGKMPVFSPPVGEFKFDARIESGVSSSELAYFVDLNMPEEVLKLADSNLLKRAVFIDHHIQKPIVHEKIVYHNPLSRGVAYPSASFVVSEMFDHSSYLTLLGGLGDVGESLFEMEDFGERAEKIMESEGLEKRDLIEAVRLVDSNYMCVDRYGVEEAALFLRKAGIDDVLEREDWIEKAREVEEDISRAVSEAKIKNGVAFVSFFSSNAIISRVVREIVWKREAKLCVAVNKGFNGKYQIYLRVGEGNENVKKLIERLRSAGINAGGKAEVLGCVFNADESAMKKAMEIIKDGVREMGFDLSEVMR